tara:strand:+ start:863 stop:1033 length:171 start_codon:yes stop_codon:yes gene_type:complete
MKAKKTYHFWYQHHYGEGEKILKAHTLEEAEELAYQFVQENSRLDIWDYDVEEVEA